MIGGEEEGGRDVGLAEDGMTIDEGTATGGDGMTIEEGGMMIGTMIG